MLIREASRKQNLTGNQVSVARPFVDATAKQPDFPTGNACCLDLSPAGRTPFAVPADTFRAGAGAEESPRPSPSSIRYMGHALNNALQDTGRAVPQGLLNPARI